MFSISSQLTLDPRQFEGGITKAGAMIQLFGRQTSQASKDASKGMDKYDSTLRNTGGTIQGLSARLKDLQSKLSKVEIGSRRFEILNNAVKQTKASLDATKGSADQVTRSFNGQAAAMSALSAISLGKITSSVTAMMRAAQQAESQMIGLSKIIENRFGAQSVPKATAMVSELSAELGLTKEAVIGTMKNLSSMNFTLEQQADLIRGATDIAVDNRQSHYDLSESVKVWSDGLKNNNSTLSDAIGISENIAAQYKRLGIVTDSLTDKTAGLGARQALVNDFMGQFAVFQGRAAENMQGYAGATALAEKSSTELGISLGAMYKDSVTPLIAAFAESIKLTSDYSKTLGTMGKSATVAATAGAAVVAAVYSIGTALNATGIVASRAWLKMLGPLGLGITALTFTIDYVIRERRETDLARIQSNVNDLRRRFGESATEANRLIQAVNLVEQNLNNGIGTTEDASRTLNQLGQSFGIVNLQTRNMTRSQMEMHIRALNDAFQQQYRQTQNNVNGNTDLESTLLRLDASQKKLKNSTKGSKEEAKDFWSEWQRVTGNLTPVENSIKNVTDQALILKKTLNRPYESPFAKFAAGAKLALSVINELGQSVTNFFNAQAQLASVIQQNNSQNLAFLNQAIAAQIDQQTQVALDQADSEISIIESKIREIEETEQEYRDRSNQEYEEWLAERKRMWEEFVNGRIQLDEELFRTESEKLQADIFARRDALLAQNNDEVSQAMIKEKALSDLEIARANLQDELKAKREEELAAEREKLDAEEVAKKEQVDADILTNEQKAEAEKAALLARQQEIEDGKAAIQAESDRKKKEADRVMRLMEWQSGKVAFEANKKAQMATAAMGAAQSITQGAIAAASIMAGFWSAAAALAGPTFGTSLATVGPLGMVLGPAVGAGIAGIGIATSAMAMQAAQAPQYPPPPMYAKGGMVGGMPHSLGGTLIEAERNEFVVNRESTRKNLNLLNAVNSGANVEQMISGKNMAPSIHIQNLYIYEPANGRAVLDEIEKEMYWRSERV